MKTIIQVVNIFALAGSIGLMAYGYNLLFHDTKNFYSVGNYKSLSVSKADGITGYTEFTRDKYFSSINTNRSCIEDKIRIFGGLFGETKSYTDGFMDTYDGKVDHLFISEGCFSSEIKDLRRERDYLKYKQLFDDADKEFSEVKKRFKEHFKDF